MGARLPKAPTICLGATKIFNEEPARAPKTDDSYGNTLYALTSNKGTTEFPAQNF